MKMLIDNSQQIWGSAESQILLSTASDGLTNIRKRRVSLHMIQK